MATVLVTGAGGFIGSHLVERLVHDGDSVRGFVRYNSRNDWGLLDALEPAVIDEVEVFVGDLANPEAVVGSIAGVERIYHLGALIPIPYSYRHPREYVTANIEATLNVLEACRRFDVERLVQVSTSEVYGTAQIVPIPETHPLNPQSPYAATKVAADQLALSFHRSFSVPVVVARPFNTYGPRQSARAVIPTIISQALGREIIELGALTPTRDLTFVADTVVGLAACGRAATAVGEVINLGSGTDISIGDLASAILAQMNRRIPVASAEERLRPPDSEVERLIADTSRATELLGWSATVPLEEGLRRTIAWIEAELERFRFEIYNV